MAIINELTKEFLTAQNEIEVVLKTLFFNRHSFIEKGQAYYIEFIKNNGTKLEFLFGPSDWDVEMIIVSSKGKFAFKDLLDIPEINSWVNSNQYRQDGLRNLKNELLWFIELLKVSLPYVE